MWHCTEAAPGGDSCHSPRPPKGLGVWVAVAGGDRPPEQVRPLANPPPRQGLGRWSPAIARKRHAHP